MPVGAVGHLAFRRHGLRAGAWFAPVLLASAMSATVEILQTFQPLRTPSFVDIATNIAGAAAGVPLGRFLAHRIEQTRHRQGWDPVAAALAVVWVAWLLFPAVPEFSRIAVLQKIDRFWAEPLISPLRLFTAFVVWLVGGRLLAAEGLRKPKLWLWASIALVPAQLLVIGRQPIASDVLGAVLGAGLYPVVAPRVAAWLLVACVAVRGVAPLEWTAAAQPMNWTPFAALLSANWQRASLVLLEKCFLYGSSVWALNAAGVRLWRATAIAAAILAVIEVVQRHLPGRVPESTDPVIAVLLALAFSARRI